MAAFERDPELQIEAVRGGSDDPCVLEGEPQ
jgi:hypothetical protein